MYLCVGGIDLVFFYWILELFRRGGILYFSFYSSVKIGKEDDGDRGDVAYTLYNGISVLDSCN
jgi:hypothetical protein